MTVAKQMRAWRARVAAMKLRIEAIDEVLATPEPWRADWEDQRKSLEALREALIAVITDSPYGDLKC